MSFRVFAVKNGDGKLWGNRWKEPFSAVKPPKVWSRRYDAEYRKLSLERRAGKPWDYGNTVLPLTVVEVEMVIQ